MTLRYYLIDDDPATLRMLERIINDHGLGIVAGTATDGITGEEGVMREQPEIVVIDLLMPKRDGMATVKSLRDRGYIGSFVVLSRVTNKNTVAQAYEAGVRFFIHKPLNLVEIRTVLRQVADALELRQAIQAIRSGLRALYEGGNPPPGAPSSSGGEEGWPGGGGDPGVPSFREADVKTTAAAAAATPTATAAGTGSGEEAALEDAASSRALPQSPRIRLLQQAVRKVLTDLGILGETGSDDLLVIALSPLTLDPSRRGAVELQQLYKNLAEFYERAGVSAGKSIEPKAIEQRLRRAATLALRHVASLGLEDYSDPRFERLAGTFFEFEEVRLEMTRLRRSAGPGGRFSLKRFIEAFLWTLSDT
ncbi:MAG: response regulator [Firmicutes bacterium]|nr:response regulator [Bacillota bacterium]